MGRKPANLTDQVFDRLTVLEPTDQKDGTSIVWKCQCECGEIVYA